MFFYPNRDQAIKIQKTLETLYKGVHEEYYHGEAAWAYVEQKTQVPFKQILDELAEENARKNGL